MQTPKSDKKGNIFLLKEISKTANDSQGSKHNVWRLESTQNKMLEGRKKKGY